jgi:hypothetical protein
MIEMILIFYVQFKVHIRCYEEFNWKILHVLILVD